MTVTEKIAAIRQYMKKAHVNCYVIPTSDPHNSEYLADHWQIRQWVSGFTGSAGTLVITETFSGLWVDSRYFIQAEQELEDSGISLMKLNVGGTKDHVSWISSKLKAGDSVGIDGSLFTVEQVNNMHKAFAAQKIHLHTSIEIISKVWLTRPSLPVYKAFEHDVLYAGLTRADKLEDIRSYMDKENADYHLLTALDDIAWTFNIRGTDISYNPVVVSYALIAKRKATLFIDAQKLTPDLRNSLSKDGISVAPYHAIGQILSAISGEKKVLIDPKQVNYNLYAKLKDNSEIIEHTSVPSLLKSLKNEVEIAHIRQTMIKDGVAMVQFLKWLEEQMPNGAITEVSAAKKLYEFRANQDGFQGESFNTISAYADHSALPHYSPSEKNDTPLDRRNLYLVDSGGQYLGGTTDITRTVTLGEVSIEQQRDFTCVLKGHIALAKAIFPAGTKGHQLDSIARLPLWKAGLEFGHGTGHGVGYFLNVHEGPQRISQKASEDPHTGFANGMLTSNEPGVYRPGEYGIRIENLVLAVPAGETAFGSFLKFETVTLCPIDLSLIDADLLNIEEKKWLNAYHNVVFERLAPHLKEDEVVWLNKRTKPIA